MSELVAIDQDGEQQFIWLQEKKDTCGPACVYMIERIVKQMCPAEGETRIAQIASLLPDGYREGNGTASYTALAKVLNMIGMAATAAHHARFSKWLEDAKFPFITRIGWPDDKGHFVVCAGLSTEGTLICMDPWYGLSEPDVAHLPSYRVTRNDRAAMSRKNPIGGVFSGHTISLA